MQKTNVRTFAFSSAFAAFLAGSLLIAPGCGDGGAQTAPPQPAPRDAARSTPAYEPDASPAAPQPQSDPAPSASEGEGEGNIATFLGLRVRIPNGWAQRPPHSIMHDAMFHVPGVDGAGDAQVVVFGNIGGSNEANIARWETQFRSPDGGNVRADVRSLEAGGLPATIAELEGEYRGMGMAYTPNQRFLAAIIEIPRDNPIFIRLVGDHTTVTAHREAFIAMIEGIEWLGR